MGRFAEEFVVANNADVQLANRGMLAPEKVRRIKLRGFVDSAATYLVLPEAAAEQLGLPPAGETTVRYADQRTARRKMAQEARVELLGRSGTFRAVLEPDRDTALIGAIVLEDLDLLVDCTQDRLCPRDPGGIIAELD
jgi:predicted aspartyl protease